LHTMRFVNAMCLRYRLMQRNHCRPPLVRIRWIDATP